MKHLVTILSFLLFASISKGQEVQLGQPFSKWSKDFTLKGISTKTNKSNYQYNKGFSRLLFNRKVDILYVTTKNGTVIGIAYMLIPKNGEEGVPKDIVAQFEKEMGVKLINNNGTYGISDNNVIIQFSRNKNPELGGDRIMYYSALVKDL